MGLKLPAGNIVFPTWRFLIEEGSFVLSELHFGGCLYDLELWGVRGSWEGR